MNMNRPNLALIVPALAFALAACGGSARPAPTQAPKTFAADKCGLTVQMPSAPKEETRTAQAADGPLEITLYTAMTGNSAYVVSCNDLPVSGMSPDDLNRMLDNLGAGAMTNIGATLDGQTAIELEGHPGRDISGRTTVQGQDAVVRARVFLVGNRMIQAMVLAAKGQATDADMTAYLASLSLTK
jgi:hypothetical protein